MVGREVERFTLSGYVRNYFVIEHLMLDEKKILPENKMKWDSFNSLINLLIKPV